jgi:PilZ domain
MIEKRHYPRYEKTLKVGYCRVSMGLVEASSTTKNVSRSGLCCRVSRIVRPGDALRMDLALTDGTGPTIKALGTIIWTSECGQFELDAGIRFTRISPSEAATLVAAEESQTSSLV